MMGWLLGSECVPTLERVLQNFRLKARAFHKTNEIYSPWMSNSDGVGKSIARSHIDPWQMHEREDLKSLRSEIKHSSLGILQIKNDRSSLEVFPEVSEVCPEWQGVLAKTQTIFDSQNWLGRVFSLICRDIVPIKSGMHIRSVCSVSSFHLLGALFLSVPKNRLFPAEELLISICHELGHQVLFLYQKSDRIIDGDLQMPIFSGIRGTQRPAIMAFHAAVALSYMVAACRWQMSLGIRGPAYDFYMLRERVCLEKLAKTLEPIHRLKLTLLGEKMLSEMSSLKANERKWA